MPLPGIDDIAAYGGFRYARGLPFDPRYERQLDDVSMALAAIAGMTSTCPRVWARIGWDPSGDGTVTILQSSAVWVLTGPTSALLFHGTDGNCYTVWGSLNPTADVLFNGTSDGSAFSVTWPSPIVDALYGFQSLRFRFAWGYNIASDAFVGVSLTGTNTIKVWLEHTSATVDVFAV